MASASYSFLDIAVLDGVRERFAAGDALALLSADLRSVLWANGNGAQMFGYADIETAMGEPARLTPVARRQIQSLPGYPRIGRDKSVAVRIAAGMKRHKRKGFRDMLSAQILLQNFLDAGCPTFERLATPLADPLEGDDS